MKRILICFELLGERYYNGFFRRLHALGEVAEMNSQWILLTPFTVDQIEEDLRDYLDPADRLLVTYVEARSSRNLINGDRFETGAA